MRKRAPWVDAVVVKRALSNVSGDLIPPARAREAIRAGASGALERLRAGDLQPYRGEPAPYEFEVELKFVVEIAEKKRLAIVCSEADPMVCHRERILAQVLRGWGVKVTHIMPDGSVSEPEQQALS